MTIAFNRDTPVLWFDPDDRPEGYRGRRAWFLCPVVAHRILLAESMVQGLNMVERLILDLARAGIRRKDELATRSGLPRPLVHLVIDELIAKGLLDERLVPTMTAERELEELESDEEPSRPAMVFTNPSTGLLWPRVVLGDPPQAREYRIRTGQGFTECSFTAGRVDRPIEGKAISLPTGPVAVSTPRSRHILDALRQHGRAYHGYRERRGNFPESLRPIKAARAIATAAAPKAMYILTFAYVPRDSAVDRGWTAADPFGLGRSDQMARTIREALHASPVIEERIRTMVDTATERVQGETVHVQAGVRRDAGLQAARRLGAARDGLGEGWGRLFDLVVDAEEEVARSAGRAADLESNCASKVYVALEELLRRILDRYGAPASLVGVHEHDRVETRRTLERCATELGFAVPDGDRGLPMLELGWGKVNSVVKHDGRGLGPLLAAGLMAAAEQDAHPLRTLAGRWSGCLPFIQKVILERNPESHGEGSTDRARGEDLLDGLYRIIDGMAVVRDGASASSAAGPGDREALDDLQLRIRTLAIHAVQAIYGPDLDLFPRLFERLARMQYRLEWIRDAEGDAAGWSSVGHASIEFLREASPAVECALSELLRSGRRAVDPSRLGDPGAPRSIALALGFSLADGDVIFTKPEGVQRALRSCQGSLAGLVRALLLSAEADPEHPLHELGRFSPGWLDAIAELERARGHADRPLPSAAAAIELAERVHLIVQDAVDALRGRRRTRSIPEATHHVSQESPEAR